MYFIRIKFHLSFCMSNHMIFHFFPERGSHTNRYWFRGAPWEEPGAPGVFCFSSCSFWLESWFARTAYCSCMRAKEFSMSVRQGAWGAWNCSAVRRGLGAQLRAQLVLECHVGVVAVALLLQKVGR